MPKKRVNALTGLRQEFEHFTDHVIPYLVVGIAIVLILENPFWTLVHLEEYEPWVTVFDSVVVFFFVVDLSFKWFRTKEIKKFVKLYWIDIIAVFPFYLGFRAYAEIASAFRVGEEVTEATQKALHEAVLLREAKVWREAELAEREAMRLTRETRFLPRMLRSVGRFLRLLKGRLAFAHNYLVSIHRQHRQEHKKRA